MKILFPVVNIVSVTVVFALLKSLLSPSTGLEYTAILLITAILATPIANLTRKEMRSLNTSTGETVGITENKKVA